MSEAMPIIFTVAGVATRQSDFPTNVVASTFTPAGFFGACAWGSSGTCLVGHFRQVCDATPNSLYQVGLSTSAFAGMADGGDSSWFTSADVMVQIEPTFTDARGSDSSSVRCPRLEASCCLEQDCLRWWVSTCRES
jgi:hypothetical protein